MVKHDIDRYFHMATHGDNEAYKLLYKEFVNRANIVIHNTIKTNSKFTGIPADFCDVIDDLFFQAINEFEQEKKSFSAYVDYLFSHRLVGAVKTEIHRIQSYMTDVDYTDDEEVKSIELLSDPTQPSIQNELVLEDFKQTIASPNKHKPKNKRIRDKVLILQYAGFKNNEICKALKITYPQLRRILMKMEKDEEITNIKLDLK